MIFKTGFEYQNGAAPAGPGLVFNMTNLNATVNNLTVKAIRSRAVELDNGTALPVRYVPHSLLLIPCASGAFTSGADPFGMTIQYNPTLAPLGTGTMIQPNNSNFNPTTLKMDRMNSEALDRDVFVSTLPYVLPQFFQIEVDVDNAYTCPANFVIDFEIEIWLE